MSNYKVTIETKTIETHTVLICGAKNKEEAIKKAEALIENGESSERYEERNITCSVEPDEY